MRRSYLMAGGALMLAAYLAGCSPSLRPLPELTYADRPCYRTLADVDCHPYALVGEESRRVGFYDQPIAVKQPEPWPQSLF